MQGIVPQLETAAKTKDGDNRKLVRRGDFCINSRSDRKGSSGLSELDGTVSLITTVMTPRATIDGAFAHHLLRSYPFQEEYYRWGKGIVADLWSTNFSAMANITLPIPPLEEQKQIAAFLDHETTRMDRLITLQERLIELLKEKRQAVISQAVTKGLDPSVSMKKSGIQSLSEVPSHWRVQKLAWNLSSPLKNGVSPPINTEGSIPSFSIAAVRNGIVTLEGNLKFADIGEAESESFRVRKGDILALRGNGNRTLVGSAGILLEEPPEHCIYPDILIRIRLVETVHPQFLIALLNTALRTEIELSARTASGVWKISGEALKALRMPLPSSAEQTAIVRHCSEKVAEISSLISKSEASQKLLAERKSALISAAVTGKIDVRNWEVADASPP